MCWVRAVRFFFLSFSAFFVRCTGFYPAIPVSCTAVARLTRHWISRTLSERTGCEAFQLDFPEHWFFWWSNTRFPERNTCTFSLNSNNKLSRWILMLILWCSSMGIGVKCNWFFVVMLFHHWNVYVFWTKPCYFLDKFRVYMKSILASFWQPIHDEIIFNAFVAFSSPFLSMKKIDWYWMKRICNTYIA